MRAATTTFILSTLLSLLLPLCSAQEGEPGFIDDQWHPLFGDPGPCFELFEASGGVLVQPSVAAYPTNVSQFIYNNGTPVALDNQWHFVLPPEKDDDYLKVFMGGTLNNPNVYTCITPALGPATINLMYQ